MIEDVRAKLRKGEIEGQAARLRVVKDADDDSGAAASTGETTTEATAAEMDDDELDLSLSSIKPLMVLPMYS